MEIIKKFLYLLTPQERIRASLLLVMVIIMALLEMIGVVSILPFMAVLTNPGLIETNYILNMMYQVSTIIGVKSSQQFIFILGVLVFVFLITSLTFKALTSYAQLRFVQMRQYTISKRLVEGYLMQPYSWFLNRHSADLGKTILSEVSVVIENGLGPLIELTAKGIVVITLIILLVIIDPLLAFLVGFSLSLSYGLIFYFINNYLNRIGKERLTNNHLRFKSIIEAFGAIKEVKIGGLEQTYIDRFSNPAHIFARTQASSEVISFLPRYFLESIAFGGVLLMILYLISQTGSFNNALPIISLYVFAGYRLIPALQQVYSSITQIRFISPALDILYNDVKNLKKFDKNISANNLSFKKEITLKNIYYNYPNSSRTVLHNINLSIPIKSTIGLVGATGSGKTTIVDIILGLLELQKGTLEVDGRIINYDNLRSWQRIVGYVPQHIYLSDDSISANIAFGLDKKDIDQKAVENSAKIANLHDFILDELPEKYQSTIGERGVKLSGGQRQRIGIARALYHNPQVLILDEATSALDDLTEQAVMDAVNKLSKNITIILIAHRLNTVKDCDMIFKFDKGKLVKHGKFNDVVESKGI